MSNEFFNPSNAPGTGAALSSATMRAEFNSVSNGFAKLPTMVGNAGKLVHVNSGATALQSAANVTLDSTTMTFGGTAQRIKADFSNATNASRLLFQTTTASTFSSVGVLPSGTGANGVASWAAYNNTDPDNASVAQLTVNSTEMKFSSTKTGTGSYLPMTFYTNNTLRASLDSNGVTIPTGSLILGTPTPNSAYNIYMAKSLTGGTDARGVYASLSALSDVTNFAIGFASAIGTSASSFTLNNIMHFSATAGVVGAGSTVSNQYGFNVDSTLTGATNNYAFRSGIPAGTNRWNLYMDGTADNYLAGKLGVGTTPVPNAQAYCRMAGSSTSSSEYGVYGDLRASNASGAVTKTGVSGSVFADPGFAGTGTLCGVRGLVSNSVGGLTIPSILGVNGQANLVFGGTITNIACFRADVYNTGGATISASQGYVASDFANNNHVGFYSQVSSGTGKLGFYAQGTAQNAFIGTTTIGSLTVNGSGAKLQVSDGITFPAAQVASSDANTLDDYEEGTFTPALAFGAGSVGITYTTQTGRYTKVGNTVMFRLHIVLSAKGSSTGTATISLPFAAGGALGRTIPSVQIYGLNSNIQYSAFIANGASAVQLQNTPGTTVTNITDADFSSTTTVSISGQYEV